MEITLEKIELVKDRTGASYKDAKEALEACDGSVVDAIIKIEESMDQKTKKDFGEYGNLVLNKLKELIKKGNVSKITVKKQGDILLNVPVNVGILGTIISPLAMIVGVAATFGFKCVIEVVKEDGTIFDVTGYANEHFDGAVEKGSVVLDSAVAKGTEIYNTAKDKATEKYEQYKEDGNLDGIIESFKDKAEVTVEKAKEKAGEYAEKAKEKAKEKMSEAKDKAKDAASDAADKAKDFAGDAASKAKDFAGDAAEKAKDFAGDAAEKAKDFAGDAAEKAKDAADKFKEASEKNDNTQFEELKEDLQEKTSDEEK